MAIRNFNIHSKVSQNFASYDSAFQSWLDQQWKEYNLPEYLKDQFYSNPYASKYRYYQQNTGGIGSDIMQGLFGDSSFNQNALQANEDFFGYWNNLQAQAQSNEYNSEEQKAKRMMSAGINPNLLGTGDVADDVRNPEPMFGSSFASPASDASTILNTFSCVNSILGFGSNLFALAQGFQALKGVKLDNDIKSIAKYQDIGELAASAAAASITPAVFESIKDLSPEDKAGLIAGDSDLDEFLDVSSKTSSAADAWIKSFPEPRTRREQNILDKARADFVRSRNSQVLQADSWEAFDRMRKAQASPAVRTPDIYAQLQDALVVADYWDAKANAALAQFNANLYDDVFLTSLLKNEKFASIYASIAKSNLEVKQANVDSLELDIETEVLQEDHDTIKESLKESFKAAVSQYVTAQAQAALLQTAYEIRQQYLDDMKANGFVGQVKYRPLSPQRALYNEAKGASDNSAEIVGKGIGAAVDAFITLISLGM